MPTDGERDGDVPEDSMPAPDGGRKEPGPDGPRMDHRPLVMDAVRDAATFLRLTLSGKPRSACAWRRISVRPVVVKGRRRLQFTYFDGRTTRTCNADAAAWESRLASALELPFPSVHVQTSTGDLHVRVTRKGKALVARGHPSCPAAQPDLSHDRAKEQPLPARKPDTFLQAVGIMDSRGGVRPGMRAKFHQINEFLRVVIDAVSYWPDPRPGTSPLFVDCGCGSAYLTFAIYHYFRHVAGIPVRVSGVDHNADAIETCRRLRDDLGWDGVEFTSCRIADFTPATAPDAVFSLHACDTATDEAISKAVEWRSRVVVAAPCCQHELHARLRSHDLRAAARHGILRERLADIMTDAFRAAALRVLGYRTSVIEFVSPEHTTRNLLLRALASGRPGRPEAVAEYRDLRAFWQVTPAIEDRLGDRLTRWL